MKAVILAGGIGSRISEESHLRPKPMIEIGGKPLIWHIMKAYSQHDVNDFIVCLGYKGYIIKEYFSNYFLHTSDVTLSLRDNKVEVHQRNGEDWTVTLVDTGASTMTGGRLKRVSDYIGDETFLMSYGDGVSDVNITESIKHHNASDHLVTVTAIRNAGRYGKLIINDGLVHEFSEKPVDDGSWINGGFFVIDPPALQYISGDQTSWEREPLQNLAKDKKLGAFIHNGFWQSMDTLREKNFLEELWARGEAPWKTW